MARTIYVDSTTVDSLLAMAKFSVSPAMLSVFLAQRVQPYLAQRIESRFAANGDSASGKWLPLSETSLRIRHEMGQMDDNAINDRTGAMKDHLTSQFAIVGGVVTELRVPGNPGDDLMSTKIETAQFGGTGSFNGATTHTPPRPVLAVDATDTAAVVGLLQTHVMDVIGGMHALGGMIP
jgi:hypothetical protein